MFLLFILLFSSSTIFSMNNGEYVPLKKLEELLDVKDLVIEVEYFDKDFPNKNAYKHRNMVSEAIRKKVNEQRCEGVVKTCIICLCIPFIPCIRCCGKK